MNEKATVHVLYEKLLALYPREFKERFGESMEQSFNDLYKERRADAPRTDASPVLWVVLWLLSTGFVAVLMLIVRGVRTGNRILANPFSLLLSVICLAFFAWPWLALVIDQMPCLLGGSGC